MPFKWPPNLEVKMPNFKFCITNPYPQNELQIWRSNCKISNSSSPLSTLQMTSKFGGQTAEYEILHHHSVPFKWASNLEVKLPNIKFFITTLYPSNDLQIKLPNMKFCITTPYPSNDLQIWRSNCEISNSASPRPQILHHHAVPFKWLPNLEVKLQNSKFCITTPYPSNDLQISRSNWRIWNSPSPLRTLRFKFRGQTAEYEINLEVIWRVRSGDAELHIRQFDLQIWRAFEG